MINRRNFLITTIGSGFTLVAGSSLWYQLLDQQNNLDLANLLSQLRQLNLNKIHFSGQWSNVEVFNHLAQSVEFSMMGYPEHKSAVFKSIIGKSAFHVFQKQASMSHSLHEPIPGAADIDQGTVQSAFQRLILAIESFSQFKGQLQPHFAYGKLTHKEYADAHAMHVLNHFEELTPG